MKKLCGSILLLSGIITCLLFTGCIKDEKPNVECDIEEIVVADEELITYTKIDRNSGIVFLKRKSENFAEEIKPSYIVSEGATYIVEGISDEGSTHTETVKVTSEDKQYSKTYTILFAPTEIPDYFGFEYWDTSGKYEKPYEPNIYIAGEETPLELRTNLYLWDSGNLGFSAVAGSKQPKEYPTFSTDDAYRGSKAAKLVTRATGSLGTSMGKPIAAGNIFLGEFSGKGINLLKEPLKATRFGYPYNKIPTSIDIAFKYKAGTYDYEGNTFVTREGTPDICAIYAIFFDNVIAQEENSLDLPTLDGANVFTSSSIIAMANLHYCDENVKQYENGTNGEWVSVNIPFKSVIEGTDYSNLVDAQRLANQEYSLVIVCCSSYYGDYFEGAIDSELTVDDITIHYEN